MLLGLLLRVPANTEARIAENLAQIINPKRGFTVKHDWIIAAPHNVRRCYAEKSSVYADCLHDNLNGDLPTQRESR